MRGCIDISISVTDEHGKVDRIHKNLFVEARGHDRCKAEKLVEDLYEVMGEFIEASGELKRDGKEYTV